MYKESFLNLLKKAKENQTYIGQGNPTAKILFVGKELSGTEMNENIENSKDWIKKINENQNIVFTYNDEKTAKKAGHTWTKYQILHNCIFPNLHQNKNEFNFLERVFTTEMNIQAVATTAEAKKAAYFKERLEIRKKYFLTDIFIQEFDVIVLACSDYIKNVGTGKDREIDSIFNVTWFKKEVPCENESYYFNLHYDSDHKKLVIHCRQLSGAIPNVYLEKMGLIIQNHLETIKNK